MHPSIQTRREILDVLHQRSALATTEFYRLINRHMPVTTYRVLVKPAGREFFHVVDSQTDKVLGFRRDHNEACELARRLELETRP
jgi:hypothetical protein